MMSMSHCRNSRSAARLRVLSAPDGSDVVAPERHPDRLPMLCRKSCERNGEIESERDISIAVVAEAVDLPLHLGFRVQLPEQDLAVLERGRLDRSKTEVTEHSLADLDAPLLHDRALRQLIGEALQRARLDARRHRTKVLRRFARLAWFDGARRHVGPGHAAYTRCRTVPDGAMVPNGLRRARPAARSPRTGVYAASWAVCWQGQVVASTAVSMTLVTVCGRVISER